MRTFYNQILAVGEDKDGLVKTETHTVVLKKDYKNIIKRLDIYAASFWSMAFVMFGIGLGLGYLIAKF